MSERQDFGFSGRERYHHPDSPGADPLIAERVGFGNPNGGELLLSPQEREKIWKPIIEDYAAIDTHLKQTSDGKNFAIDMWLTEEPEGVEPISEEEAIRRLKTHVSAIDRVGLGRLPKEYRWAREGLIGYAAFLEECEKVKAGEKTPIGEYAPLVSGYVPEPLLEDDLEIGLERVQDILQRLVGPDRFIRGDDASIREALSLYEGSNRIRMRSLVESGFRRFDMRYRPFIGNLLNADLSSIDYEFQWEEANAFWKFWERVVKNSYYYRSNWHPRQRSSYTHGAVEAYVPHELAHFAMAFLISREIKEGRLDPIAGAFPIPGPGCFMLEGLALNMPDLANLRLTDDGQLFHELYLLWVKARYNGLLLLENGASLDEVISQFKRFAPHKSVKEIEAEFQDGLNNPFERAYLGVYGRASYDVAQTKKISGNTLVLKVKDFFRTPSLREDLLHLEIDVGPYIPYGPHKG